MCNQPQTVAGPGATRRGGFTLVELLVVILIVGMLAALVTPAVIQALTKARNTAIKAEIDMLHMAVMNYKNEYGSFPPCSPSASAPEKHLARIFPRMSNALQQLLVASKGTDGSGTTDPSCRNNFNLAPDTALVFWLEGYTKSPASPLVPASARSSMFDFEEGRKLSLNNQFTGIYHPSGKPGSPYIYIDSAQYPNFPNLAQPAPGGNFFNKDTFQILCAGRDEEFGTDDDLSNFWPGTRREYEDSLKK